MREAIMGMRDNNCWVLVALCLTFALHVRGEWTSKSDEPFTFYCPKRSFLRTIVSKHTHRERDREYDLYCAKVPLPGKSTHRCSWSQYVNDFDKIQVYQCPGEGYIAGIGSYHSDYHEDRRYRFYCCRVPRTKVHGCTYTGWKNMFHDVVSFVVPEGKILRGMISYHWNKVEDRRFQFEVCDIAGK